MSEIQKITNMTQATVKRNVGNLRRWGGGGVFLYEKVWSSSRVQVKDSGLTLGVDDETSPFLAVKVSFNVHSNKTAKEVQVNIQSPS